MPATRSRSHDFGAPSGPRQDLERPALGSKPPAVAPTARYFAPPLHQAHRRRQRRAAALHNGGLLDQPLVDVSRELPPCTGRPARYFGFFGTSPAGGRRPGHRPVVYTRPPPGGPPAALLRKSTDRGVTLSARGRSPERLPRQPPLAAIAAGPTAATSVSSGKTTATAPSGVERLVPLHRHGGNTWSRRGGLDSAPARPTSAAATPSLRRLPRDPTSTRQA